MLSDDGDEKTVTPQNVELPISFGFIAAIAFALLVSMALWSISGVLVAATLLVIGGCLLGSATHLPAEPVDDDAVDPEPPAPIAHSDHGSTTPAIATETPARATDPPDLATPAPPPRRFALTMPRGLAVYRIDSWSRWIQIGTLAVVGAVAVVFYLQSLDRNPVSLFCDEAEIGLESYRLIHGNLDVSSVPLFYHHFTYDHMGILPLVTTAPFVAVLGLDDLSVRLSSAVLMLALLAVLYMTLRRLQTPFAVVAVTLLALSPAMIHLSRVNFGHAPSMLAVAIAFDRYVVARQTGRRNVAIASGILFGISPYGNGAFYVITPVLLIAILLSELIYNRLQVRLYRVYAVVAGAAGAWFLPIVYRASSDDGFWRRFDEKEASRASLFSTDRIGEMLDNYPKYFSFAYLFDKGESGLPGAFISRHSVAGAGELGYVALPVLIVGFISLVVLRKDPLTRYFLPWFILAALYPLPDVLTTTSESPPYTLAVFGCALCIPFIAGCALRGIQALSMRTAPLPTLSRRGTTNETGDGLPLLSQTWVLPTTATVILALTLLSGWRFYTGPYHDYPLISADYWGWQYGPKQMISYYVDHEAEYDEFLMDGNFNEASVFLDFYIRDPDVRNRASIGDLSSLDLSKRQLIGIRSDAWNSIPGSQMPAKSYLVIDDVIEYPNGDDDIYLAELR